MPWSQRGQQRYYYCTIYVRGRQRRRYVGGGERGQQAAEAARESLRRQLEAAVAFRQERARLDGALAPLAELWRACVEAMRLGLGVWGYRQHNRGAWRRKLMSDASAVEEPPYPPELRALLLRGQEGDAEVLPALRKAFTAHPELASRLGDAGRLAEASLFDLASGQDLTTREALSRRLGEVAQELAGEAASPLEKLLAAQTALNHLATAWSQVDLDRRLERGEGALPGTAAAERRLGAAERRLMAAARALAVVRRLAPRPTPSPLELLGCSAATEKAPAGRGRLGRVTTGAVARG
jgi:hypothetical protein